MDMQGDGLKLTGKDQGVRFDLDGRGQADLVAWTAADSGNAFLVIDSNHNGLVDSGREIIGTRFVLPGGGVAPNGVTALWLPLQGVEIDGTGRPKVPLPVPHPPSLGLAHVDAGDAVFKSLLLWTDRNHDGKSAPDELRTLESAGVRQIATAFKRLTNDPRALDGNGNRSYFSGWFTVRERGEDLQRTFVEIALKR